jgi:hypothetical protein
MNDQEALKIIQLQFGGVSNGRLMTALKRAEELFAVASRLAPVPPPLRCANCGHDSASHEPDGCWAEGGCACSGWKMPAPEQEAARPVAPSGAGEVESAFDPTPLIREPLSPASFAAAASFHGSETAEGLARRMGADPETEWSIAATVRYIEADRAAVSQAAELRGARKVLEEIRAEQQKLRDFDPETAPIHTLVSAAVSVFAEYGVEMLPRSGKYTAKEPA